MGQGNVFTGVCHSVDSGVCHLRGICLPTIPGDTTGYGQQAGGTHTTGMHPREKYQHRYLS